MFTKKTVFIVGAGASAEFDLPVGDKLKNDIASLLLAAAKGDNGPSVSDFRASLLERVDLNAFFAASRRLASAIHTFISVDEALHYLSSEPMVVTAGKTAVAHLILEAERKSKMQTVRSVGRPNIGQCSNTWLAEFFSMALALLKREAMKSAFNNITFINFNYDRVIEQFLYHSLIERAHLNEMEATKVVTSINIIRPYGSLGSLDWQQRPGVPYGGLGNQQDNPIEIGKGLLTYAEDRDQTDLNADISKAISESALVFFIGFGFHQQNMSLLNSFRDNHTVYGTAMGIDPDNYPIFNQALRVSRGNVRFFDRTGYDLLSRLRPSIMAAQ